MCCHGDGCRGDGNEVMIIVMLPKVKCGPVFAYISNKEFEVSKNQNTFVW